MEVRSVVGRPMPDNQREKGLRRLTPPSPLSSQCSNTAISASDCVIKTTNFVGEMT